MGLTTASFPEALRINIEEWKDNGELQVEDMVGDVFNVNTTDKLSWEEHEVVGPAVLQPLTEGENKSEGTITKGYPSHFQTQDFSLRLTINKNFVDTNQYTTVKKRATDLSKARITTKNLEPFGLFRNGWSSNPNGYADGVNLFSINHPNLSGDNQSNTLSSSTVFGYEGVWELLKLFDGLVGHNGVPLFIGRKVKILYPPALSEEAEQLQANMNQPDTADRNVNTLKKRITGWIECPWLSADAGTLAGDSDTSYQDSAYYAIAEGVHTLGYYERIGSEPETDYNKRNRQYSYDEFTSFAYGYSSWLGVVGSKGDGSTIST